MIGDKSLFSSFNHRKGWYVSYGDNNKGEIIGTCTYGKFPNPTIGEVLLVYFLKHNHQSVSQLCDKGENVIFDYSRCRVINYKSTQTIFTISRSGNIYTVNLNKFPSSDIFFSNEDESCQRHVRVAHIHINYLNKLVCKYLVIGL